MLRIGFDALFFEQPMTGSGQYATQLWPRLAASFPDLDMLALAPSDTTAEAAGLAGTRAYRAAMPRL